eukprot:scaffold188183_cov35-Tisochrysis_lutea.AAC.1
MLAHPFGQVASPWPVRLYYFLSKLSLMSEPLTVFRSRVKWVLTQQCTPPPSAHLMWAVRRAVWM